MTESTRKPAKFRTLSEVAKYFGVQTKTVQAWRQKPVPMPGKSGNYRRAELEKWHSLHIDRSKQRGRHTLETDPELLELDLRTRRAKADKEEAEALLKHQRAKSADSGYRSIDEINEWMAAFFLECRRLLDPIPGEVCASYPDNIATMLKTDMKARLDLYLNQMADWIERVEEIGK